MGFRRSGIREDIYRITCVQWTWEVEEKQSASMFIKFSRKFMAQRRLKTLLPRVTLEGKISLEERACFCLPSHLSWKYLVTWYFKSYESSSNTVFKSGSFIIRPLSFMQIWTLRTFIPAENFSCAKLRWYMSRHITTSAFRQDALLTLPGSPDSPPFECFLSSILLLLLTDYWFPTAPWL